MSARHDIHDTIEEVIESTAKFLSPFFSHDAPTDEYLALQNLVDNCSYTVIIENQEVDKIQTINTFRWPGFEPLYSGEESKNPLRITLVPK